MTDSPIAATPYEILGVSPSASQDELRIAYRRQLRETHPDTGGSTARFLAVQLAWERVGTPDDRANYDRGSYGQRPADASAGFENGASWAPRSAPRAQDTRPRARSYGHPGGWRRERYLTLMREWVGRGETIADPYDPTLVRSAPRELRHILADALAEEFTARTLSDLGIGFTIWHDVSTGDPTHSDPEQKIDHVVLGPTGLFAILSEDYGEPVRFRREEIFGVLDGEDRPMHSLGQRAKVVSRAARVKFSALVIILPDEQLDEPLTVLGSIRGATTVVVRRSVLPMLVREGVPGAGMIGGNELFDARTRLQAALTFV
ncbi:hypothetical protein BH09ACT1_BH09ACT1_28790 [soil metagenome]